SATVRRLNASLLAASAPIEAEGHGLSWLTRSLSSYTMFEYSVWPWGLCRIYDTATTGGVCHQMRRPSMTAGPLPRDRAPLADAGVAPVTNSGELAVDWFRRVLASAGLLSEADLSSVELQPVSGGLMARMVRATLSYAAPTSSPDSLLVKFPTDDAGSLGVAQ